MAKEQQILVPDIGAATDVEVIEVMVSPGDHISEEDSIITLESEKASMEIPSPHAGIVKNIQIKIGDKVSQGNPILTLASAEEKAQEQKTAPIQQVAPPTVTMPANKTVSELKEVNIPDIGTTNKVDVIEVNVTPGQKIAKEDTLITLESEKASMELPSPYAGEVKEVKVAIGNKVAEGDLILTMQVAEVAKEEIVAEEVGTRPAKEEKAIVPTIAEAAVKPNQEVVTTPASAGIDVHAGPGVRRLARELGVDLHNITGSGLKNRITYDDIHSSVKNIMTGKAAPTAGEMAISPMPTIDFSQFGDIESKPLSKIKRLTGANVHRSWVTAPHVTQFDEADITEMEAFRKANKSIAEKRGFKLTPLVFLMKAVVACLKEYPNFNSSLDPTAENLILKKYFNVGVAVDTPNGLVVPVVRSVDQKGLYELADELAKISKKARGKGLMPADMQGSCFTISSLGGIGGTAFTPIINMPDVAILGVSKAALKPVHQNDAFVPRLMLPLSLSYDHRVIDGAEAARFTAYLAMLLSDIRQLLL